ncbi:MAG: hypothetical protein LUG83_07950 [Lachnospiraceae bacterium]|nr:hypothetical protein [Lachnospiraceae bacterium]
MKSKNHNIRFNTEKEDECRAWELLHSPKIRQMFKSQNRFVIEAVNDYYDRCVAIGNDPYLETREKEDAFAERIVETVEKKVMSNLPALFGMYMAQIQAFPLSVSMGAYGTAQGSMMYGQGQTGALPNGTNTTNAAMPNAKDMQGQDKPENASEPPDNDLIDFDAF